MRSFSGQIIQIIPFVQEELRTGKGPSHVIGDWRGRDKIKKKNIDGSQGALRHWYFVQNGS